MYYTVTDSFRPLKDSSLIILNLGRDRDAKDYGLRFCVIDDKKYVLMNAPSDKVKEICAILPGIKSPTVLPLATEGWTSIHAVIDQKHFWEIVGQLKAVGAEGILVLPIEKMIL